jgi:hypothetical protein
MIRRPNTYWVNPAAQNSDFGRHLHSLVTDATKLDGGYRVQLVDLCRKHQIQHRRIYDIINVFTTIGCAARDHGAEVFWTGRDKLMRHLKEEQDRMQIHNDQKSLSELFSPDHCVDLASLTLSFVLFFGALDLKILDMRDVSAFFSRDTMRYKSTLSKLHEISLILGELRVSEKTGNVCEVEILDPFWEQLRAPEAGNPLSIGFLLNRPARLRDRIPARLAEYREYQREHRPIPARWA